MGAKGLPWGYIIPAIIVIAVVVGAVYFTTRSGVDTTVTTLAPGDFHFPFSCLATSSTFLHIHPWLQIFINNQPVTIPGAIGIQNPVVEGTAPDGSNVYGGGGSNSCFEPVHTHDDSGVIHIESPTDTNYTLGNFFQIWAATYAYAIVNGSKAPIVFSSTDILGFTANSTGTVTLLVDGVKSTQFGSLVLDTLAYCNATNSHLPSNPCHETTSGDPEWDGGNAPYPYGTGHTIIIEYNSTSS